MISAGSKRVLVTIPITVKDWLQARAIYSGGTQSRAASRSIFSRTHCTISPGPRAVRDERSRPPHGPRRSQGIGNDAPASFGYVTCDWPTDIMISVQPDGDSWRVTVMQEGSVDDTDRREMVEQIAARLKGEYDLKR
jgi:hypothetical protein